MRALGRLITRTLRGGLFVGLLFLTFTIAQSVNAADPIPSVINQSQEVQEYMRICLQRNISQGCNCPCKPVVTKSPIGSIDYSLWWCRQGIEYKECNTNANNQFTDKVSISTAGVVTLRLINGTTTDQPGGGAIPLQQGNGILVYNGQGQLDLGATIPKIITLILMFAGFVAAFLIIQGGFTYINSQGNDDEVRKGTQTMLMAVLGLIIVLISIAVVEVATGALGLRVGGINDIINTTPQGVQGDKDFFNP